VREGSGQIRVASPQLLNCGSGIDEVATRLRPLLDDDETQKAVEVLLRDFADPESVGPRRVAEFIGGGPNDEVQADVVGFVAELLRKVR